MPTHYSVLNVSRDSSLAEIKDAYHAAARQWHPDRRLRRSTVDCVDKDNDEDNDFRQIQSAWECLRDTNRRKDYDTLLLMKDQRIQSKRQSATRVEKHECYQQKDDSDGVTDSEYLLVYPCRCGEEIDVTPIEEEEGGADANDDNAFLVECPGCSLTYDISAL